MRFVVLVLVLASFQQLTAQSKVLQARTPAWVTPHEYNNVPDTAETANGYAYLLISRQWQLETKEEYCKFVMKVTAEEGLSIVASINEYFDPSFQKLTFHEINIIRNGNTINRLDPAKFDVLRREEEMERAIYDKSVSAIYNLPDVRVGDIVEYSFTRKGWNPAFGDHSFGTIYLQYGTPVGKFAYRIVYDPKRPVKFKSFGEIGVAAQEIKTGSLKGTEWMKENVSALLTDDQLPSWYDPFPHVQFSDFESWNDLKAWARHLYEFPKAAGALKKEIDRIAASGKSDEEKIKECIRIVQADIRYLSFSDGIHGYKPHAPETVFNQKFGDCKDKSFTLVLMLNELGITSHPALVSTSNGYTLPEVLPSPWAFNHCIVQFVYKDSTYWIDPTLNAQVGPLKSYFFPSYHHALVVNDDSGLASIPFGYKNSKIAVHEEYTMDEVGAYATLKVRTVYSGDEADEMRSYFRSNTKEKVSKDFLNFYARDFSEINTAKDFQFQDDPATNTITASEEYLVKNFWTLDAENQTATVYASVLATYLKKPETRVRTMPLAITHPTNIEQTVTIRLPEEWSLANEETAYESDAFTYRRSKSYSDKVITLHYHYKTKASFIDADAASEHIAKLDAALNNNGLTIFKSRTATTSSENSVNAFILVVLVVVAAVVYMLRKRFA